MIKRILKRPLKYKKKLTRFYLKTLKGTISSKAGKILSKWEMQKVLIAVFAT